MSNTVGAEFRRSSYCASGGCVEVAQLPDGSIAVRYSKNARVPQQVYTQQEWSEFIRGAKAGEFDFGAKAGAGVDSATVRFSR